MTTQSPKNNAKCRSQNDLHVPKHGLNRIIHVKMASGFLCHSPLTTRISCLTSPLLFDVLVGVDVAEAEEFYKSAMNSSFESMLAYQHDSRVRSDVMGVLKLSSRGLLMPFIELVDLLLQHRNSLKYVDSLNSLVDSSGSSDLGKLLLESRYLEGLLVRIYSTNCFLN